MLRYFFGSLFWVGVCAIAAQAQMADVPRFNADGDFPSARVQGNRGTYPHWQWLVVETDEAGLNCRNAYGEIVVTLAYGAVVDSVFAGDEAIESVNGQPWLRVKASDMDLRNVASGRADSYTCYVRANTQYITPINPDTQ